MKLWLVTFTANAYVVAETREDAFELAGDMRHEIMSDNAPKANEVELVTYRPDPDDCASLPYVDDGTVEQTVGAWFDAIAAERADLASRTDDQTIPLALPYPDGRVERVERVTLPAPDAPEEVL